MDTKKILHFVQKVENFLNRKPSAPVQTCSHKVHIKNIILLPLIIWGRAIKHLFLPCGIFAAAMSLVSFVFHQSLGCSIVDTENYYFQCQHSIGIGYLTFLLVRLFVVVAFARVWYDVAFQKQQVLSSKLYRVTTADIKLYITSIVLFIINILPIVCLILLVRRVPNPDWRIESLYFAVVSCGFWIPIIAIRFYSLPAFILERSKVPSFKKFLDVTSGHSLSLISSFSFVILYSVAIMAFYTSKAEQFIPINSAIFGVVGDYFYNVFILVVVSMAITYSLCTKQELFDNADNCQNQQPK